MAETTEERTLDELLALDTYQGMTDTEIERVVEYRSLTRANESAIDELKSQLDTYQAINRAVWVDHTQTCREEYAEQIEAARKRLDASYGLDYTEVVEAETVEEVTPIG